MQCTYKKLFIYLFFIFFSSSSYAEMTIERLIFDNSKSMPTKILETLPKNAVIQIGPENAKNTIIEFMDYFCGYCKKMNMELMEIANDRSDVRVIFVQYPILNESSNVIAKMVIAANFQGKGFELHHAIFSTPGSLTKEKLEKAILDSGLDIEKIREDIKNEEIDKLINISSFIAGGVGARGTPALFINNNFAPGYIPKSDIINLLN